MTNNFELCWLHHCTNRCEKQVRNDRKFITLKEKTWCPVHLKIRHVLGNLSQCFQARVGWIKTHFFIVKTFPWNMNRFFGATNLFSNPANVAKSLLDGNKDHLLTETRCELMMQEYKVESLNTCITELQQQACAQRLELQGARGGCVESRRKQVRLQEELAMKEKALRDTQIRSMHEMGEMKRAQQLRVDEFSVQKNERKSWHDTEAHFTNTRIATKDELHERFQRFPRSGIE